MEYEPANRMADQPVQPVPDNQMEYELVEQVEQQLVLSPPAQPPFDWDKLPDLVFYKMLEHLKLREVTSCRLVSKKFKKVADYLMSQLFRQLFITCSPIAINQVSVNCRDSPNFPHLLHQSDVTILSSPSFQHNFRELKSLKIDLQMRPSDLSALNEFRHLESLYLEKISLQGVVVQLKLPKLRVLLIAVIVGGFGAAFEVQSAVLQKLICPSARSGLGIFSASFHWIRLSHPGHLLHLTTSEDVCSIEPNFLATLTELQVLKIQLRDHEHNPANLERIVAQNSLRELHFDWEWKAASLEALYQTVDWIRARRRHLIIFVNGTRQPGQRATAYSYRSLRSWETEFRMQTENYANLTQPLQDYVLRINYHNLLATYPERLPGDFFQMFCNIRYVYSGSLDDRASVKRFFQFVNCCKELNTVECDISHMSREFSKGLTLECRHLHQLVLIGYNPKVDIFFITQLDQLWSFEIRQWRPRDDDALSLFEKCSHLRDLFIGPLLMIRQARDRYQLVRQIEDKETRRLTTVTEEVNSFEDLRNRFRQLLGIPTSTGARLLAIMTDPLPCRC